MRYRVAFSFHASPGWIYFSEWFDTFSEASIFLEQAAEASGVISRYIEDEDGEVI